MDVHNLVDMANRIGDFFESMPDREEAIDNIADHIRRFWEPRMRRALLATLHSKPEGLELELHEMVREALVRHREELTPKEAAAA
ncbi:formate dehydrogenase subunit delta [Paraburkholderia diazotrophica]|uniref:Formate dehydrogenase delta subunit n=1 Tax=Paraburkholderia diazotrophica TaxID=667676 RepID=A0A1H7AD97_9BURK|nr:formate dehydrogenase subunit delta [Paraburkholderia diazotrophica]SEJ63561.1 formate dehydrogenase delta subunit [Paraburkholderia diazotrophica]